MSDSKQSSVVVEKVDQLRTKQETADILRVGLTTVWRLMGSGELRAVRIGGSVRFPQSEIDKFIQRNLLEVQEAMR